MATCPRCLGPLGDGHRCSAPVGLWNRIVRAAPPIVAGIVVGASTCFLLDEHPSGIVITIAGGLGAVVVAAAAQALGGRS